MVYQHAEDGSRWVFQDGLLQEVIYRNGWRRSYFYSFGKISKIQDQFGRQIEISYGANGPVSILTPGGGVVRYVYGESGNLSQVIYPDGSSRSYVYIDSENYPLLVKIYDENGVVFSEFAYDSKRRATSSSRPDGVGSYGFSYYDGANPYTRVKDPLGQFRDYWFSVKGGAINVTSSSRISLDGYDARWRTVNEKGLVVSDTNALGVVTKHSWDVARYLPTSKIEAADTADQRTTSVTWHSLWRLPVAIHRT